MTLGGKSPGGDPFKGPMTKTFIYPPCSNRMVVIGPLGAILYDGPDVETLYVPRDLPPKPIYSPYPAPIHALVDFEVDIIHPYELNQCGFSIRFHPNKDNFDVMYETARGLMEGMEIVGL